jgi:AraC-like DNA-binding protein/quercetin dioxygenase-like cupin family protein
MTSDVRHGRDLTGRVVTVRATGGAAAVPTHVHVSLILGRIDAGERQLTVAGVSHVLRPGDGFIVAANTAHSWTAAADAAYRVVVLDPADFPMAAWRSGRITDAAWIACFDDVHATAEAGDRDAGALALALLALTGQISAAEHPPVVAARVARLARGLVAERLDQALDLADLGRLTGVSPFHLHRLYRATWGLTPAEQRLVARLRQARRLILSGAPIAQVATAVGFADQSHLNRAFRRLMGVPPGRWLRQMRRR